MSKLISASYQFYIPKNFKNNKTVKKIVDFEKRKATKFTKLFDHFKKDANEDLHFLKDLSTDISKCHDNVMNNIKKKRE